MVFKVYTFSGETVKVEGNYHNHIQAFRLAIQLSGSSILTYIIERQWDVSKMALIDKNYIARNKSVYNTDDMSIPIFSQLNKFAEYDTYRKLMYGVVKNIQSIYNYMKVKCPYSDEYIYSYTYAELKSMESTMLSDSIVIEFYQIAKGYYDSAVEIMKVNNMPSDNYIHEIVQLNPIEMMSRLKGFHRSIKNYILKNMYGATLIEMYPL